MGLAWALIKLLCGSEFALDSVALYSVCSVCWGSHECHALSDLVKDPFLHVSCLETCGVSQSFIGVSKSDQGRKCNIFSGKPSSSFLAIVDIFQGWPRYFPFSWCALGRGYCSREETTPESHGHDCFYFAPCLLPFSLQIARKNLKYVLTIRNLFSAFALSFVRKNLWRAGGGTRCEQTSTARCPVDNKTSHVCNFALLICFNLLVLETEPRA